jgi:hypothetical protein
MHDNPSSYKENRRGEGVQNMGQCLEAAGCKFYANIKRECEQPGIK